MTYTPEEIRKWKNIIYGNNGNDGKVDDWAGQGTGPAYASPRKSPTKKKWGSPSSRTTESDDWLGSPSKGRKSYTPKGHMAKTPF
jgi:hypothetical protein